MDELGRPPAMREQVVDAAGRERRQALQDVLHVSVHVMAVQPAAEAARFQVSTAAADKVSQVAEQVLGTATGG